LAPGVRWAAGGIETSAKELEQENAKLQRLVSELSLEKLVLKNIAAEVF